MKMNLKGSRWILLAGLVLASSAAWATQPTSYFIYDESGHVIGEYDADGNVVQEHVYLGDRPLAVAQSGSVDYVSTDQLGTPRTVTDGSQAVAWTWNSDPFGNGSPAGSLAYNLRLPGQYFDSETANSYNYFRDYNPGTGRYIEPDPIGVIPGLGPSTTGAGTLQSYMNRIPLSIRAARGINQLYLYVGDKPTALMDPFGLYGTSDCSYYGQRCQQVGGIYYCYIAPAVCNASPNGGWSGCVRQCLQSADRTPCNTCSGGPDVHCTVGAHLYCWSECAKNPNTQPPLAP